MALRWGAGVVALASVVLAGAGLAGCSTTVAGHPSAIGAGPTGTGTTTPTAPSTDGPSGFPSTPATASALTDLLMPAPGGSHPWDGVWARASSPTVDQFVARVYAPQYQSAETARLRAQGLVEIAHRTWVAADGNEADMILLRFATEIGARSRFASATAAKASGPGVRSFDVPGRSGAVGYYPPDLDSQGNYRAIVYAQQTDIVMELFYYCPAPFSATDAIAWTNAQLARLP